MNTTRDTTLELLECEGLRNRLNIERAPCDFCYSTLLPSHFKKGIPSGCLAAHIGNCLLELKSIKISREIIDRRLIVDAILLHDIGKLTEAYRQSYTAKRYLHNVYSALFIYQLRNLNQECRDKLALSAFLHHEYYAWKRAYEFKEIDIFKQLPYRQTKMEKDRVIAFIKCMRSINQQINENIDNTLNLLEAYANLTLKEPKRKLAAFRVTNISLIAETLVLTYLLYLIDNRAAILRENRFEWLKNEFMKLEWDPEKLAKEITEFENRIGARNLFLSLLPDYLKMQ